MFSSEAWQQINTKIVGLLPGIFSGIVVFILFWIGAALLRGIVIRVGAVRGIDPDLTRFLGRATRVATLVFGMSYHGPGRFECNSVAAIVWPSALRRRGIPCCLTLTVQSIFS